MTTATFTVNKYYCKALGDEESNCGAKELNDRLLVEIPVKELKNIGYYKKINKKLNNI